MKLALVVVGDGRSHYLAEAVRATKHILYPIGARLMIDDSGDLDYGLYLDETYPDFEIVHGGRRGMAGAVQAGFDLALEYDPDFVLWLEEDMVLTRDLPVADAMSVLGSNSRLAQMTFKREPWWGSEPEMRTGDQLAAICELGAFVTVYDCFTSHDYIFSLNPCVIPRRVLELGWDADNEAGMTKKLLGEGYRFAMWGHVGDEPYARHIGERRGAGWRL